MRMVRKAPLRRELEWEPGRRDSHVATEGKNFPGQERANIKAPRQERAWNVEEIAVWMVWPERAGHEPEC